MPPLLLPWRLNAVVLLLWCINAVKLYYCCCSVLMLCNLVNVIAEAVEYVLSDNCVFYVALCPGTGPKISF